MKGELTGRSVLLDNERRIPHSRNHLPSVNGSASADGGMVGHIVRAFEPKTGRKQAKEAKTHDTAQLGILHVNDKPMPLPELQQ